MFDGNAPAGTTVTAVREDRIHLTVDEDRRGDGQAVPLRAVVFLRESPDGVRVDRVPQGSEVLPDLWTLALRLRTDAEHRRSFTQLARLAAAIPVWNLHRPMQVAKLDEVVSRIVEACSQ
jgi:hypothetical protein